MPKPCRYLRQAVLVKLGCQTPLILLTGYGDREVDLEAMKRGAADYLAKDRMDAYLLERTVRYSIQRRRSEESREKLEKQLFESQKLESIGKLAGGVAHQFNNLLTPIIGYTQQLMGQVPKEDQQRHKLEAIDNAAVKASNLVRQLLTFSQGMAVKPTWVGIDELVQETGRMYGPLLGEDVYLVVIPGRPNIRVKADSGQIQQVLLNLIVNARDAMPEGGRITIETSALGWAEILPYELGEKDPGEFVVLSITDMGTGMTEEVKAHLFEPFFTTKQGGFRTGLGLASSHGLIKQMGGHIEVETELHEGTCFKIYLPGVAEPPQQSGKTEEDELPLEGTETILIIEDESLIRQMAGNVLREQGYTVLEATDAKAAMVVAREHPAGPIQLMMCGVVMPQMDGVKMSLCFRGLCPDARIMLMSGYPEEYVCGKSMLGHDIAYLSKPFTSRKLLQKVRDVFDCPSTVCLT